MSISLPHLVIYTADTPTKPKNLTQGTLPSSFLPSLLPPRTFATHLLTSFRDVTSLLFTTIPAVVLLECEGGEDQSRKYCKDIVKRIRFGNGGASGIGIGEGGGSNGKRVFILLWSKRASIDARERYYWTSKGVNMITNDQTSLQQVLTLVQYLHNPRSSQNMSNSVLSFLSPTSSVASTRHSTSHLSSKNVKDSANGNYSCPYCGVVFSLEKLHMHVPLYHAQEVDGTVCTVCEQCVPIFGQHLKETHPVQNMINNIPSIFYSVEEMKKGVFSVTEISSSLQNLNCTSQSESQSL
ncbi:hypothetical protein HK099_003192 [Clydaea vesicula]|uniref:Uncharacterized protein n=1 Tax=Clydaea vesicula TaxID=447962 RepID=A0AAD5XUD2_9FUNG|nr:hypothetical protein HK099_003192 [Clydaea vesicula]